MDNEALIGLDSVQRASPNGGVVQDFPGYHSAIKISNYAPGR